MLSQVAFCRSTRRFLQQCAQHPDLRNCCARDAPALRPRCARSPLSVTQGNPDVDNNIHKFRRMRATETDDLTQTDALRLMGLLEDKVVKTANYLSQGSSLQKQALKDLDTSSGGTGFMDNHQARAAGYACQGNVNGKKLIGIKVSSTDCALSIHRLRTDCPPTAHRLPTDCPSTAHQLPTDCAPTAHRLLRRQATPGGSQRLPTPHRTRFSTPTTRST